MAKTDNITQLLEPVIEDLGYELVGLEYGAHPKNGRLLLYIDQAERGITLEDCEIVSREVGAQLDVHDVIPGAYRLEVSSPGLDRPLYKLAHYQRFQGEQVKLSVAMPVQERRKFSGTIRRVVDQNIVLEVDGEDIEIEHANIVKARLVPQF